MYQNIMYCVKIGIKLGLIFSSESYPNFSATANDRKSEMSKWIKTNHRGIRYREHDSRKVGRIQKDRYYSIRYQVRGVAVETGIGWLSEGVSIADCIEKLKTFKANAKTGGGATIMKEQYAMQPKKCRPSPSGTLSILIISHTAKLLNRKDNIRKNVSIHQCGLSRLSAIGRLWNCQK